MTIEFAGLLLIGEVGTSILVSGKISGVGLAIIITSSPGDESVTSMMFRGVGGERGTRGVSGAVSVV